MNSTRITCYPADATRIEARGYRHGGKTWAVVNIDDTLSIQTADELEALQRLADACLTAIAQARQAEQDETLAEFAAVTS